MGRLRLIKDAARRVVGRGVKDLDSLEIPGLRMSAVDYVSPESLRPNPLNEYPPLEDEEMEELKRDILSKGVLVPLIRKPDGALLAGHNRREAALALELTLVPVQTVLSPLTADEELDVMKSENDRRRGGNWSKEKKLEFIREKFGDQLTDVSHGGDRTSKNGKQGSVNLAREVERKSRGRIPVGTAKRLVSEIRKEAISHDISDENDDNLGENGQKSPEKVEKSAKKGSSGRKVAPAVRVRDLMDRVKSALVEEEPETVLASLKHIDAVRRELKKLTVVKK